MSIYRYLNSLHSLSGKWATNLFKEVSRKSWSQLALCIRVWKCFWISKASLYKYSGKGDGKRVNGAKLINRWSFLFRITMPCVFAQSVASLLTISINLLPRFKSAYKSMAACLCGFPTLAWRSCEQALKRLNIFCSFPLQNNNVPKMLLFLVNHPPIEMCLRHWRLRLKNIHLLQRLE